jgi:putative MATE family efflux protein
MTDAEPTAAAAKPRRGLLAFVLGDSAHVDYTQGSISRAVWLLAIPMVVEMAMESLFAVVDIYWVNHRGPSAVAAVTMTESLLTIVYAFAIGLTMPVTALVARRIGEKNPHAAGVAGVQAIGLGVVIAAAIGIPAGLLAPQLLFLMQATDTVVAIGSDYARWVLGGNIAVTLLFLNNAILRGAGDARLAMLVLVVSNSINIALDPCLIYGWGPFPALGVTGAGVATFCGRSIGVVLQLYLLWRGAGHIRIRRPQLHLDGKAMLQLLRMAIGGIGQFLIATASWVLLMYLLATFQDESVVAGYGTAIRLLMFFLMPAWGLSNAAATLVGQNLGAMAPDRAARSVWITGVWTMVCLAVVTVVMETLPATLLGCFTADPEVLRYGALATRILASGYVFYAWGMVMVQAFNGAGDTWTPTWLNFVCFWLLELPLAWWLSVHCGLGPEGVFWAVPIAESTFAVLAMVLFRRGRWREHKV